MILRTVEQVRRVFLIIAGFTVLLAGVVMLATPGSGMLAIFLGLSLLPRNLFGRATYWTESSAKAGAWLTASRAPGNSHFAVIRK